MGFIGEQGMKDTLFGVSFLVMLAAYTVGTFYPDTRGCTGPLTVLAIALVIGSTAAIMRAPRTKARR